MLSSHLLKSLGPRLLRYQTRSASIISALNSCPVLVSSNRDIYTNLALEHWLYTNLRFHQDGEKYSFDQQTSETNFKSPIVLIWTDEPCLVMGRHQNPWIETKLGLANKLGIKLARRHSGGGCVYHDENNINISIIGNRKVFDHRQDNLKFLAQVLDDKYGINCEPNKRHDLIHSASGKKMSGSAAKLGRFNSYHHFTLLVDTDTDIMQAVIRQQQQNFIGTNSSASTRSNVINLNEIKSNLTVQQVVSDLTQAYGKQYKSTGSPKPPHNGAEETRIEGDREDFESLRKFKEELMSFKWIYGMTPKFKLERHINFIDRGVNRDVQFRAHINGGLFEAFDIDGDSEEIKTLAHKFDHLIGTSFVHREAMVNVVKMLDTYKDSAISSVGEQLFATYLLQMIHESNF